MSLSTRIKKQIQNLAWEAATPSLQVGVQHKGVTIARARFGENYKYYDLASLTKVLFTTSLYMRLVDRKILSLQTKIQKNWGGFPFADVKLKDLLSHSAGMPAWHPYYKKMRKAENFHEAKEMLRHEILKTKRRSSRTALYSDIDFFFLRFHLETLLQVPLESMWEALAQELGLAKIHFCMDNQPKYEKSLYAPTEKCPWRKKTLQGEVHDDNTWTLGGVSTHAGLFGDLNSVLKYTSLVREALFYRRGSALASQATMRAFMRRRTPKGQDDWATGFMMPSDGGSCGKYFSKSSIGHTGFTGTSLWFDPKKDISVVILSNRVHPRRTNSRMKALRPQLHDVIIECLKEDKRIKI